MINLKFEMPILLDNMDNEVDGNYAAMPERLYVIDPEGKIAYRSEMGPWGFDAEAWRDVIGELVSA